jgi:hypothetical protein
MIRRGWLSFTVLGTFALFFVVGCGVKRVPVAGTATLDGQPINGGSLQFTPDAAKGNMARIVCTSPIRDGRYNLETSGVTRAESGAGVPPGWYKVTFFQQEESTKKHKVVPVDVHPKFRNVETTPLSVEVKDNPDPGAYDFKLTK